MRKTIAVLVTTALLLSSTTASAQTLSKEQLIAQLKAQIAELTIKLQELQKAEQAVREASSTVKDTTRLLTDLQEGMSGSDVRALQEMLAKDRSIYPEGKITGYYGKHTREAVKRYLKKHGSLPKPCEVYDNSKTWNNGVGWGSYKEKPGKGRGRDHDDDDEDDDHYKRVKNPCVPGSGTTTPPTTDTTAPTISSIAVASITSTGASITFTTNEQAITRLFVGTTSPVGTTTSVWQDALSTTHTASLTGLTANTVYYYVVEAKDAAGNKTLSAQGSFTTLVTPDTTAPVITALSAASTGSTTASVIWTTNENSNSKVYVSTTTPVNTLTATLFQNATLVTAHNLTLSGLLASTTYYVLATSGDASNNVATSSEISFTTGN